MLFRSSPTVSERLNLLDSAARARAFAKIKGSCADEVVYTFCRLHLYLWLNDGNLQPMLTMQNLNVAQWQALPDGNHRGIIREVGVYTAFDTDEPVQQWVNPVTGEANNPVPFYTQTLGFTLTAGEALPTLGLNRVYVLSTAETCSASEAVVNGLRGIDFEVNLIGATTCGKPYGFYPQDNCGETYYTIQFQGANDKNFGDFADGFVPTNSTAAFGVRVPGCRVDDALTRELGDPAEGLLAAALRFRATGTCPAVPAGVAPSDVERPASSGLALDRKSTRLNSSHVSESRMPSSA